MAAKTTDSPYAKRAAQAAENQQKRAAQAAGTLAPDEPAAEPVRNPGGRPRTAQNRTQFTLKTLKTTRMDIKRAALDHGCTASDVVDELARQFLDRLDWSGIERDV